MKLFQLLLCVLSLHTLNSQDIKVVEIENNAIIYNPHNDRIYVATTSVGTQGNSLCIMNPYFGTIEACYFVGSDPSTLALSEDGLYLYVGLRGAPQVIQFNTQTNSIERTITLGSDPISEPYYAEEIAVLPGTSETIVVSRMIPNLSPRHGGLAIYDQGVMRVNTTQDHTGSNSITFLDDGTLYGYNNETTEFGLRNILIDAAGLQEGNVYPGLINTFYATIEQEAGRIYSSYGTVIETQNNQAAKIGTNNLNDASVATVEAMPDTNLVYYAYYTWFDELALQIFDKNTFSALGLIDLPQIENHGPQLGDLINWGPRRLAFNTSHQVVLLHYCTSLIPDPITLQPNSINLCEGETDTIYAPNGYEHYVWSTGDTTDYLAVNESGNYTLSLRDTLGCASSPSNTVQVSVSPIPEQPIIEQFGNTLVSSSPLGNQWYFNNELLVGETSDMLTPNESGSYTVQVTENGCSSTFSAAYNFTLVAVDDIQAKARYQLFPNPAQTVIQLHMSEQHLEPITLLEIVNIYGQKLGRYDNYTSIPVAELPSGLYWALLYSKSGQMVHRVPFEKL